MSKLTFDFHQDGKSERDTVTVDRAILAGWTGRDPEAIRHHIDELAAIGIKPPSTVPLYYRIAASLLTQAPSIQVLGDATSGEIEPVLFCARGKLWLTLGSDHTDREAERAGVALSKQLCPKPIARTAWLWNEVHHGAPERLDGLLLESFIIENEQRVTYQQGTLAQIRPLAELVAGLVPATGMMMKDGLLMFCGTLAAKGGVRSADRFSGRLEDQSARRSIELDYGIEALPVVA